VSAVQHGVLNFVFGIEHHGDDVGLLQAKKNAEVIFGAGQEFCVDYLGLVVDGVAIVILESGERFGEGDSGDEDDSCPVMK
jgi:hypothetical protein